MWIEDGAMGVDDISKKSRECRGFSKGASEGRGNLRINGQSMMVALSPPAS